MGGWSLVVVSVRWSSNTPTAALHRLARIYSRQVWPRCDLQKRLVGCGILGSDNFVEFVANFVKFALHTYLSGKCFRLRIANCTGQKELWAGRVQDMQGEGKQEHGAEEQQAGKVLYMA
ncbi:hypothetical protein Pcinc_027021 [Petrolisthes cinctipes]|uniref:Uncharacterized protein n=1 Tax=Petrolisthes cinctipes TaxID=88211 RepID=A0AAE1F4T5_PETCI|nr:hypothetical protein Pcinc_027021 [Petrolisthes cinctipes]